MVLALTGFKQILVLIISDTTTSTIGFKFITQVPKLGHKVITYIKKPRLRFSSLNLS